jgi:putative SOS response-associated peptidase YedK
MYNIRNESIEERSTWSPLFMKNHGVLSYSGFYEWVKHPKSGELAEIFFFPKAKNKMWSPALHEHWTAPEGESDIDSFAVITMEPPKEVESMGHDRCPIFPKKEFQSDWLNPQSCNKEFIYKNLTVKEAVVYSYLWPNE